MNVKDTIKDVDDLRVFVIIKVDERRDLDSMTGPGPITDNMRKG